MNKRNKKDLQTEQLFGERLLKAGRIILLIVPTIFLTTPIIVLVLDPMAMKYYLEDLCYTIIGFLLSLLMYVLLHFWVIRRRSRYDQYARGEFPDVIKVKAFNDRVCLCVVLAMTTTFCIIILWCIVYDWGAKDDRAITDYIYKSLGVIATVAVIVFLASCAIKSYKGTFYSLEIRDKTLYISYRGALTHTIPLSRIDSVYFFKRIGIKSNEFFPRMDILAIQNASLVLHIKLGFDDYLLLKTFFSQNNIEVMDTYKIL